MRATDIEAEVSDIPEEEQKQEKLIFAIDFDSVASLRLLFSAINNFLLQLLKRADSDLINGKSRRCQANHKTK